jgi:hypothetical protein
VKTRAVIGYNRSFVALCYLFGLVSLTRSDDGRQERHDLTMVVEQKTTVTTDAITNPDDDIRTVVVMVIQSYTSKNNNQRTAVTVDGIPEVFNNPSWVASRVHTAIVHYYTNIFQISD